jgi:hypothetical protein
VFGGGDALRGSASAQIEKRAGGVRSGDGAAEGTEDKRVPRDRQPEARFSALPSGLGGTEHN